MSSRCRSIAIIRGMALCALAAACDREDRRFRELPGATASVTVVRETSLQPGTTLLPAISDSGARVNPATYDGNAYQENAYAVSQGQKLYVWYNCVGCHANGGGGMGPPFMDEEWRYGSAPVDVYRSIMEGRPNGMPSWAGRIPEQQVWQLVAYVRSFAALTPATVRAGRSDHMMTLPGSMTLENAKEPRPATPPPPAAPPSREPR